MKHCFEIDKIARKALTNMVMEKSKDYPEPKPEFMQL